MSEQHIIVNGILEHDGKIFLAKRAKTKKIAPGKWHLPGGHIEFGETPKQALAREFKEEFKLNISVGSIVRAFSYVESDIQTIGLTYRISCNRLPSKIYNDPSDNERIEWIDVANIDQHLTESDHDCVTLRQFQKLRLN